MGIVYSEKINAYKVKAGINDTISASERWMPTIGNIKRYTNPTTKGAIAVLNKVPAAVKYLIGAVPRLVVNNALRFKNPNAK